MARSCRRCSACCPPARRCRPMSSPRCAHCCRTTRSSGRRTAPPNACRSAVIEGRELQATRERTRTRRRHLRRPPGAAERGAHHRASTTRAIARLVATHLLVQPGQVGEITVAGPTRDRHVISTATPRRGWRRSARHCADGGERIVHRMGDLGWIDGEGRLWFCGRKSQRVVIDGQTTLCTEQVEPVFNTHPDVRRTALVGVGAAGRAAPGAVRGTARRRPTATRTRASPTNCAISPKASCTPRRSTRFLFHPRFPVDIRHNAKIGREAARGAGRRRQLRRQRA